MTQMMTKQQIIDAGGKLVKSFPPILYTDLRVDYWQLPDGTVYEGYRGTDDYYKVNGIPEN